MERHRRTLLDNCEDPLPRIPVRLLLLRALVDLQVTEAPSQLPAKLPAPQRWKASGTFQEFLKDVAAKHFSHLKRLTVQPALKTVAGTTVVVPAVDLVQKTVVERELTPARESVVAQAVVPVIVSRVEPAMKSFVRLPTEPARKPLSTRFAGLAPFQDPLRSISSALDGLGMAIIEDTGVAENVEVSKKSEEDKISVGTPSRTNARLDKPMLKRRAYRSGRSRVKRQKLLRDSNISVGTQSGEWRRGDGTPFNPQKATSMVAALEWGLGWEEDLARKGMRPTRISDPVTPRHDFDRIGLLDPDFKIPKVSHLPSDQTPTEYDPANPGISVEERRNYKRT